MTARFLILGNPENRRVTLFREALERARQPEPRVVSWLDFLRRPEVLEAVPDEQLLFRIDSAGESFVVERELLALGAAGARGLGCQVLSRRAVAALEEDRGAVWAPRQAHLGFLAALRRIEKLLKRRRRWQVLNPPGEIAELFDKRRTQRRFQALGVPVPDFVRAPKTPKQLAAAMARRGWRQSFVKVSCSSSASCLAVYSPLPRPHLHTTLEHDGGRRYNNLRVRAVRGGVAVNGVLRFLLGEGSQVERAVPKARLDGAFFDLRVLCVEGEPAFWVVRQNRHPITNLHLGGWRGSLEHLRAEVPKASWAAAMASCRTVARAYRSLHLGIDLMFEPGLRAHRVLEANAFGDLLPNLERDGLSVYGWEIRAALRRARDRRA